MFTINPTSTRAKGKGGKEWGMWGARRGGGGGRAGEEGQGGKGRGGGGGGGGVGGGVGGSYGAHTWEPAQALRVTGRPSVPLQASQVRRCIISYEVMHTAGRSDPCSLSDLPSITWMLLGRRCGSHFSSSSAQTRRRLAGTIISSGHSSCVQSQKGIRRNFREAGA